MTCPTRTRPIHVPGTAPRQILRRILRRATATATSTALVVSALAASAALSPEGPGAPEYELAGKRTARVPVRVATFNVHNNTPYDQARAAVRRLLPYADVIGLQEFENPSRTPIVAALSDEGWRYWKPYGGDPVIYDGDKFSFLSAEAVEISQASTVEDPKSQYAPKEVRNSYATVVRLWHAAAGQRVTVVNVHLIARATQDGRPAREAPTRVSVYKQEMRAVAALVAKEKTAATVYAVGDWNIHYNFDVRERVYAFPFRQFKRQGFESVWKTKRPQRPTINDKGVIDGVWSTTAPARARVLAGFPESDHRPVRVKYRLAVTGAAAPAGSGRSTDDPAEQDEREAEEEPTTEGSGSGCLLGLLC